MSLQGNNTAGVPFSYLVIHWYVYYRPMYIVQTMNEFGLQDTSPTSPCHCGHGRNCHMSAPAAIYVLPPRGPCIMTQCTNYQVCLASLPYGIQTHQHILLTVKQYICNVSPSSEHPYIEHGPVLHMQGQEQVVCECPEKIQTGG